MRNTVVGLVLRQAERLGARRAYTFLDASNRETGHLTYAELDRHARAVGRLVQDAGERGERVLLLYPPGLDYIVGFLGCLYAGAVPVPAYPPRSNRHLGRIQAILQDCRPSIVLTTAALLERVPSWREQTPELHGVAALATDNLDLSLADAWQDPGVGPDTLAFLQYTSGSTGIPKGVRVTHGNLIHNSELIRRCFSPTEESRVMSWLPPYHDMGLIGGILQPVYAGASAYLMSPVSFLQQPFRWLEAISRWQLTVSGGPNFAYELCVRKIAPAERETLDLSSWEVAFNGAEVVRAETLDRFARAFAGCGFRREALRPCYGLAEGTLIVSGWSRPGAAEVRSFSAEGLEKHRIVPAAEGEGQALVTSGQVIEGQEVRIVDPETLVPCPADRVGEIWVSGPSVAHGYWNREEATRETFGARLAGSDREYLRTGDLGFLSGGELFVTGRLKDLIILRGRNVYPQDIEVTAERSHPGLRAGCGAAFAVEVQGEERLVIACEVERHPRGTPEELIEAVRQAVALEHEVAVHDVVLLRTGTVPKTSSGKIQRRACRAEYLAGGLEIVASLTGVAEPAGVSEPTEPTEPTEPAGPEADALSAEALLSLSPGERQAALAGVLGGAVSSLLRRPGSIDVDQPLAELGLDSLAAAELKHGIESRLGVELPLIWLLEEGPSLSRVSGRVLEELAKRDRAPREIPRLEAGAPAGPGPLSHGQRALWFLERLAPGNGAYNLGAAARVTGGLDPAALERAVRALVARHPILRTTFSETRGEVRQEVRDEAEADFQAVAGDWTDAELDARLAEEVYRPFDLAAGPLLRVRVFTRPGRPPVLLLAIHHIVTDFGSVAILARELGALYDGQALPKAPELSYGDYVRWQQETLAGARGERLWSYWQQALDGISPTLELPTDRPRQPAQTFRGASRVRRLDPELSRGIAALGSRRGSLGTTLFTTMMAAFQALLSRYSGQEDFVVGAPTAARTSPRLADLLGYFVNPVVIRADLSGAPAFHEHLARTKRTVLGALEHQDFPFPLLVERLALPPDPSRSPVFQVLFNVQGSPRAADPSLGAFALGAPGERMRLGSLELESYGLTPQRSQFDLTLTVAESNGTLLAALDFNTDLFDGPTAGRMLDHLETLLRSVVDDPAQPVATIPLLGEAEREHLLVGLNRTEAPFPRDLCLHELFERQARSTPDAEAVAWEGGSLTYGELDRRANRLARHLRGLGVGPEQRVGVCVDRSERLVVSLLAVLKAGGAYVPLDASYPRERLGWILEDARVSALIAEESRLARLPEPGAPVIVLGLGGEESAGESAEPLPPGAKTAGPGNLAYLIYTSGSTGRPKAVAIEHRSPVALVSWAREHFGDEDLAGVLAATSITFDLSVFEIFVPLSWGGTVVLADDALHLASLQTAGRVTLVNTVPSAMTELVRLGAVPASVRTVNLAGEPLPGALVERIYGTGSVQRVLNLYGPSEDTTYSTWAQIEPGEGRAPAIGRPVSNTRAYVLDPHGQPAPPGVPGELLLGGDGLARGYFGRPDLTAERFVPDPFGSEPGARLYRTGDLVRYRLDGNLDFLGRIDHQVKLRGFRIELGEVESALLRHPDVREAVALVQDRRLVAFVVSDATDLRAFLGEQLPEYMVPSAFLALPALPLQPNGKVDRKALLAMRPQEVRSAGFVAPRTPAEELIANAWADVLGGGPVGAEDDFFALGGHSLLAVQVLSRVRDTLGVDLQVRDLFRFTTVAALARRVEALRGAGTRQAPPLVRLEERGSPPLSFAQQRLWFLDRLEPGSPFYNIAFAYLLRGPLSVPVLERALAEIVRRHEALRTVFEDAEGEARQRILSDLEVRIPVVDLVGHPEQDAELARLATAEAQTPFDLANGPLLRVRLVRLSTDAHAVLLTLHHIVSDGWSMGVLVNELAALYEAFSADRPSPLPELPVQYADFAVWQRRWLQGEVLEEELGWWRERLAGLPPLLELPTDRPRPAVMTHRGRTVPVALPAADGLVRLARTEGCTPYMGLLAAFATLLGRLSGQRDVAVGSPVANRGRSEIEGLIGFFANTLVMRVDLGGAPSFRALLDRARELALDAYAHQDVPFEKIVEELQPERNRAYTPLFQVLLVLQNAPLSVQVPGLALSPLAVETGTAKYDLTLSLTETDGGLAGWLEHSTDLFDAGSMDRLLSHLSTLLAAAAADPDRSIEELDLLTPGERHQIVHGWNETRVERPDRRLSRWFETQARSTPDRVAAVFEDHRITYGDLNAGANRLARRLRREGVGPDSLVGICLERSLDMLTAVLGVLKAGGAYVPLDPGYPRQRLTFMLEDAPLQVLLTEEHLVERLPAQLPAVICLGRSREALAQESPEDLPGEPDAANLAYVIFTSGSTGRPKGVALSQGVLSNLIEWHLATLLGGARTLQYASLSFDVSCLEMFMTWCSGGCLYVVSEEMRRDPVALARYLRDQAIEKAIFPVVMMQQLAAEWSTWDEPGLSLKEVTTTGEQMQITPLVARLFERLPGAGLHNHYGPSESHVVTALALPPDPWSWVPQPPIGRPIDNTQIHVLDARMQPVPVRVSGELYIGGVMLARGYLGRPDLTAEKFVPNPFGNGDRLYRTGDLSRVLEDGTIEYLGRIDHQVKLRGFRIEPGEIEGMLREHPAVREAFVLVRDDGRERYLAAYLVPAPGAEPTAEEMRAFLRGTLPEYMIPAGFVFLDRLPMTPNNKVDRAALPAPAAEGGGSLDGPRTPTEELLAGLWQELLGIEAVGRDESFFSLGGHSLLATQLVSRIRGAFGTELPLAAVFDKPTVAGLAAEIDAARRQPLASRLPPIGSLPRDGRPLPLSFAQERLWLMDQLTPDNPVFNLFQAAEVAGPLDVGVLARSFREIGRRHESLHSVFGVGAGQPVQVVRPDLDLTVPVIDLSALPEDRREQTVLRLCREEARRPFRLDRGPLLRLQLLRLGEDRHTLLVTMHHIVGDDWSTEILIRELRTLYAAFYSGEEAGALPELPIQYADFAQWQRQWLTPEAIAPQLGYWKRRLHGELPVLKLRAARPRPPVLSFRGSLLPFGLSAGQMAAVKALGRREGVTSFMVMLAAFAAVLHRAGGQDDMVIGGAVANRNRIEVEPLIGFFVNVLPLRIELGESPTYRDLLRHVRQVALEAYDNQDVPFEVLVKELQPKRNLGHTPIRQAGLSYLTTPRVPIELPGGVTLSPVVFDSGTAPLDLTLIVWEAGGELRGYCEYSTDLFDEPVVADLLDSLGRVVDEMAASLDNPVALPVQEETEKSWALTENQSLYWFAEKLQEDFYYSHVRIQFEIQGELEPGAFAAAFQRAVDASDSLRSVILEVDGVPRRFVRERMDAGVEVLDFSGAPDPGRELLEWRAERLRIGTRIGERPFYCALARLGPERFAWFLMIHHIVVDAASLGILFRYVEEAYSLARAGRLDETAPLKALPPYSTYVEHEEAFKASPRFRRSEEYWRGKLAEDVPPVQFYRQPSAAFTSEAWRRSVELGVERSSRIREVTGREGLFTASLVPLAAFFAYLYRISGNPVLRIGTTFANRQDRFAQVVGLVINNSFLQVEVDGRDTFVSLARKLQGEFVSTMRHQQYPLRNFFKDRIYDAYFNFNSARFGRFAGLPVHADLLVSERTNNLLDIQLRDFDGTGSLAVDFDFNRAAFSEAEAERSIGHYLSLLDAFLDGSETLLTEARLLSEAESRQLLHDFNQEWRQPPPERCLHEIFAEQARRTPDAVAAVYERGRLTYGELESRANRLANCLVDQGVGPEVLVGICMERSLDLVVAILGILKAGGAYLPLDPNYPKDRLAFMLADSGLHLLITQESLLDSLPAAEDREIPVLALDADWAELAAEYGDEPPAEPEGIGTERLAYVIYTSGSTGRPKGSPISHANVVRLFDATRPWFEFGPEDAWTLFHSYAFDFSVWELWGALLYGGRLVVVPYWVSRSPGDFHRLLVDEGVTVLNQTPSAFRQLVQADGEADPSARGRLKLRYVVFGGEALEPRSLAPWYGRHDDRAPYLINMYGITETTVHVTYRKLTTAAVESTRSFIGVPIPDLRVYLLDRFQGQVPVGIPGEIFVSGPGLGRGYLNRPDLTAQRFLPDPFSTVPGARMYRAGDLARYAEDGGLEYLGRVDHQVKIRGFRIELPEIEAVLARHPDVRQSVVQVWEDRTGDRRLVAYLVPHRDRAPEVNALRDLARRELPDYMVPASFVVLEELPLTPSGKLDRRALPAPESGAPAAAGTGEPSRPSTPTEELLAAVWKEVLGAASIGLDDDFFALGGHSLLATQVISRVRETFGVELPLRKLFEAPTVAAFAQLIDEERGLGDAGETSGIGHAERDGDLPLSFAQQRLWFLDQLEPGNPAYNVPNAYSLDGPLDLDDLLASLRQLVERHEALRTSFPSIDGTPVQRIAPRLDLQVPLIDLSALPPATSQSSQDIELRRLAQEEADLPFSLARGPLIRVRLVRLGAGRHAVFVTMHHVISDGRSMGIFVREMMALYEARRLGRPAELPELPIQYADFTTWQRDWMQGEALETELAYWKARLADLPPALELPTDRPRPALQSARGAQHRAMLPPSLIAALGSAMRDAGLSTVTSFMTLLAGYYALLQRYSGQDDLAVGTPIASRNRVEIENLIGFFVNMLVLRIDLAGEPTLGQVLERVRETTLGAYSHQNVPFEKLVQELRPERNLARTPLIQTVFVMQDAPMRSVELPVGIRLTPLPARVNTTKFDLTLALVETGQGIEVLAEYNRDLFDRSTIARLVDHYRELLAAIASTPLDHPFSGLPLLLEGERQQMLVEWSDPPAVAAEGTLHELFAAQARRTPEATAVTSAHGSLTYAELDRRSDRVARWLRSQGLGPEARVGLFMDRTPELVVGLLGILKSGAAYVPLDLAHPGERIAFMAAETSLVLTRKDRNGIPGVRTAVIEDAGDAEEGFDTPAAGPGNLAYVIYTSGSTGRPKGVAVEHRCAVALVRWAQSAFSAAELSSVLASTSIGFDLSVFELFAPLSTGGRVVLVDNLFDRFGSEEITLINTVPSALAALIETAEIPGSVLAINLAGEALPQSLVDRIARPGVRVLNLYGPTEDTVYSTMASVEAGRIGAPPIGRPVAHTVARVLDRHLQPVPLGAPGELWLGGAGTARGYLGRPDLTAERFVPDPLGAVPGMRLYRTGDRVRFRQDGQLEFLGRLDQQVKLRGVRVELGEIEAVLADHPGVREAAVLAPEPSEASGERRLVAFVAVRQEALPVSTLRESLQLRLSEPMVPQSWVVLESLPRSANGKVDRKALLALGAPDRPAERYVAPRTVVELQLARIWERLLGVSPVGVTADFFELGGHSLLGMTLMAQIRRQLGRELPVSALFQAPTVERLAGVIERGGAVKPKRSILVEIQAGGPRPPLFFVHAATGGVLPYLDLARHLGPQQPVYVFESPVLGGERDAFSSLEEMAALYVRELRAAQPEGPYLLGGWSLGGVVAFEMARQLQQSGQEVARLLLLDSHVPVPSATDGPSLMLAFAWDLVGHSIKNLPISMERFRSLSAEEQLRLTLDLARANGLVPASMGVPEMRLLYEVHSKNLKAFLEYKPQPYAGRIHHFRAPGDGLGGGDASAPWRDLSPMPIEVQEVPGNHYTILSGDNAKVLAERLRGSLGAIAGPAPGAGPLPETDHFTEAP